MRLTMHGSCSRPAEATLSTWEPFLKESAHFVNVLASYAHRHDLSATALLIDPTPAAVVNGESTWPYFQDVPTRVQLLLDSGVDAVGVIEFAHADLAAGAREFFDLVAAQCTLTEFWLRNRQSLGSGAKGSATAVRGECAVERRADARAARARRAGAEELQQGLARELRPRLDLAVVLGYTGVERGSQFRQLYSPIYRGVAGLNSSLQINYQPWLGAAGARGRAEQAEAALERSEILAGDLARTAVTATRVAAEGLRSARLQLATTERAVALSAQSVESEKTKFRLGMSTRFDVIQAEDALTGALLSRIAAQTLSAQAVVRLRYESGRLVDAEGRALRVDVESLLHVGAGGW